MFVTMIHGLSMALADSVPGVSGGTIAFIMGFYERFLTALYQFFGADNALRKASAIYLAKFAVGWCTGMAASILALSHIFEKNIYFMSSLFLGLTAAAIPFILYEERESVKGRYKNLFFVLLGAVVVIGLVLFRANSAALGTIDFRALEAAEYAYLLVSGLFAISAMLLPGISGSTLLLILGVYVPAIGAVKHLLNLNLEYLPGVLALIGGAIVGVIFAARFIRRGLRLFRSQMIYLIIGLLIGSFYAIIMGPTTLENPKLPVSLASFEPGGFCLGILILGGLELLKRWVAKGEQPAA